MPSPNADSRAEKRPSVFAYNAVSSSFVNYVRARNREDCGGLTFAALFLRRLASFNEANRKANWKLPPNLFIIVIFRALLLKPERHFHCVFPVLRALILTIRSLKLLNEEGKLSLGGVRSESSHASGRSLSQRLYVWKYDADWPRLAAEASTASFHSVLPHEVGRERMKVWAVSCSQEKNRSFLKGSRAARTRAPLLGVAYVLSAAVLFQTLWSLISKWIDEWIINRSINWITEGMSKWINGSIRLQSVLNKASICEILSEMCSVAPAQADAEGGWDALSCSGTHPHTQKPIGFVAALCPECHDRQRWFFGAVRLCSWRPLIQDSVQVRR